MCSQGVHGEGGGVRGKGGSVHASEVGARLRGPVLGMGPALRGEDRRDAWQVRGRDGGGGGALTCMVTTPSSSAASLRIWLASTCASSRMEKSASAPAPSSQPAARQSSQRGGLRAPARPSEPRPPRARAAASAASSSSGSRAMPPTPTPRRRAPGAGKRGGSSGRCAQGPLRAPGKTFSPFCSRLSAPPRLPNLGGAQLRRGSAGGYHLRAPVAAAGEEAAAPAVRRTPAPARPPRCGGRLEELRRPHRVCGRGADRRSRRAFASRGSPPSEAAAAARAGGCTRGGGAAIRLLCWGSHPSEAGEGEV